MGGISVADNTINSASIDKFNEEWTDTMIKIWREKISRLRINDTGRLFGSFRGSIRKGATTTIEHRFMQYGLYVASGVGKGFYHGNSGDLAFMGDEYRAQHSRYGERQVGAGLSESHMLQGKFKSVTVQHGRNKGKRAALTSGNKRVKRDWFTRKYLASIHKLNDVNGRFYGEEYMGMLAEVIQELFNSKI